MKAIILSAAIALLLSGGVWAQAPVTVQPANQTSAAVSTNGKTPAAADDSDVLATIKSLNEMKAANEEMLKKQQAVLDTLDQLQKEADQLRIYAKRG